MKKFREETSDSATFIQKMIAKYPQINGAENLKKIAKNLYPNEIVSAEKEAVRKRVFDYLNLISNLNKANAENLWLNSPDVSIITPKFHVFGRDKIYNDFIVGAFSTFKSRKLTSLAK